MTATPNTECYISSNQSNLRVRLIGEPLALAQSMSDRWDARVLRSNGAVTLRLTPVRRGGALLSDYKSGGCDITVRRKEDEIGTFGPTLVGVHADGDGKSLIITTQGDLTPFRPSARRRMAESSVIYKSPAKPIDAVLLEMADAVKAVNAAKDALGEDLQIKVDEGRLRITYVREL